MNYLVLKVRNLCQKVKTSQQLVKPKTTKMRTLSGLQYTLVAKIECESLCSLIH